MLLTFLKKKTGSSGQGSTARVRFLALANTGWDMGSAAATNLDNDFNVFKTNSPNNRYPEYYYHSKYCQNFQLLTGTGALATQTLALPAGTFYLSMSGTGNIVASSSASGGGTATGLGTCNNTTPLTIVVSVAGNFDFTPSGTVTNPMLSAPNVGYQQRLTTGVQQVRNAGTYGATGDGTLNSTTPADLFVVDSTTTQSTLRFSGTQAVDTGITTHVATNTIYWAMKPITVDATRIIWHKNAASKRCAHNSAGAFFIQGNSGSYSSAGSQVVAGQWAIWCVVFNGDTAAPTLYKNGVNVSLTLSGTFSITGNTSAHSWGRITSGGLNGYMNNMIIADEQHTAAQVLAISQRINAAGGYGIAGL